MGATTAPDTSPAVPFFTQAETFESLWPTTRRHLDALMDRGKYSHGPKVEEFETALAAWTGARHVIGVNSGTDALVLLLRAAGLRPGDEVIVPAYSFVASATSVVLAAWPPGLRRHRPGQLRPRPGERRSRPHRPHPDGHARPPVPPTRRTGCPAGHRRPARPDRRRGQRRGFRHALGRPARRPARRRMGVLSFFPTKTLGAIGDAGAVLTDDPELAEAVSAMRHHGRTGRTLDDFPTINRPTELLGTNSKMDDIQAAVLLAKLGRADQDIARRAHLAAAYTERLTGTPGLTLPTVVRRDAATNPVWYVYLIESDHRDELADHLARHGVQTETYYPTPLHLQPCFAELGHRPGEFPHAEAACGRALALPLYPDLADRQLDLVSDLVRDFQHGKQR